MTFNAFSIQATMLDITQTAMDSGDKEHVQYGIIMKSIFSRKYSCEQVNADPSNKNSLALMNMLKHVNVLLWTKNVQSKHFSKKHPNCFFRAVCFPISR
jgi:hypothetical protein